MAVSLFDDSIFGAATRPSYMAWRVTTDPFQANFSGGNGAVIVLGGTQSALEQIDTGYIVNGSEAYVAFLGFHPTRLTLQLHTNPSNTGSEAGPQLTDNAESNLAIAIQAGGITFKRRIFRSRISGYYRTVFVGYHCIPVRCYSCARRLRSQVHPVRHNR